MVKFSIVELNGRWYEITKLYLHFKMFTPLENLQKEHTNKPLRLLEVPESIRVQNEQ
jgi:hypothetical protein